MLFASPSDGDSDSWVEVSSRDSSTDNDSHHDSYRPPTTVNLKTLLKEDYRKLSIGKLSLLLLIDSDWPPVDAEECSLVAERQDRLRYRSRSKEDQDEGSWMSRVKLLEAAAL